MYNAGTCTTQLHVTDYTEFNWCLERPGASTMTSPSLPPDSELLAPLAYSWASTESHKDTHDTGMG